MNPKHTNHLLKNYPSLYRDYYEPMTATAMCWGFECGDGWFEIIDELSAKLEPLDVVATQVKEKYGTLRFYVNSSVDVADEVDDLVEKAEAKSGVTCELCGKPGREVGRFWLMTRCGDCEDKDD